MSPQRNAESGDALGGDRIGAAADGFVRAFSTPWFLATQTVLIGLWILVNVIGATLRFDPYPFILLNLLFSALAAYAAPLILVAQTRQAERDRVQSEIDASRHEQTAADQARLLRYDADQTEQITRLLAENREQTELIVGLLKETRALVESSFTEPPATAAEDSGRGRVSGGESG